MALCHSGRCHGGRPRRRNIGGLRRSQAGGARPASGQHVGRHSGGSFNVQRLDGFLEVGGNPTAPPPHGGALRLAGVAWYFRRDKVLGGRRHQRLPDGADGFIQRPNATPGAARGGKKFCGKFKVLVSRIPRGHLSVDNTVGFCIHRGAQRRCRRCPSPHGGGLLKRRWHSGRRRQLAAAGPPPCRKCPLTSKTVVRRETGADLAFVAQASAAAEWSGGGRRLVPRSRRKRETNGTSPRSMRQRGVPCTTRLSTCEPDITWF